MSFRAFRVTSEGRMIVLGTTGPLSAPHCPALSTLPVPLLMHHFISRYGNPSTNHQPPLRASFAFIVHALWGGICETTAIARSTTTFPILSVLVIPRGSPLHPPARETFSLRASPPSLGFCVFSYCLPFWGRTDFFGVF